MAGRAVGKRDSPAAHPRPTPSADRASLRAGVRLLTVRPTPRACAALRARCLAARCFLPSRACEARTLCDAGKAIRSPASARAGPMTRASGGGAGGLRVCMEPGALTSRPRAPCCISRWALLLGRAGRRHTPWPMFCHTAGSRPNREVGFSWSGLAPCMPAFGNVLNFCGRHVARPRTRRATRVRR